MKHSDREYFPDATLEELKEIDYILSRPDLYPLSNEELDSLEHWIDEVYGLHAQDGHPTAASWLIAYLKHNV